MPDNVTSPVPKDTRLATDEIGGVHFPRTKMVHGADGSAIDVSATAPMPVADNATRAPFAITPHDTTALAFVTFKGIYVGTGGDVVLRGVGSSSDVTYRNLPDSSYIAVQATHVRATGTTATNLIGEV